ncbi:hypothetical protein C8J57DRAFT_1144565 [Mycena rebaudengoi]|nr:hypothetical protein C8J57DRAFT_1144565 [Mycena rebaudengoi]
MATATASLRPVVVDDTDPAVEYSTQGWFIADPSVLTRGNFGPIYNGTSHATSSKNSTLSYSFTGTSILVQGSIIVTTDANNVTDPTWTCSVDGTEIPIKDAAFRFPENNWPLCEQDTISPGAHTLTIAVKSNGQPFYFDSLVYTPLRDAVFESAVLLYGDGDSAISYGPGWTHDGEQVTQETNAQVFLNFHGTSATLFGHVPNKYPPNATFATYAIDGQAPVTFPLKGRPDKNTQFNTVLFTTPELLDGPHILTVTHGGDSDQTPLVVKGFYVTNTSTTTLASAAPEIPPPQSKTDASPRSTNVNAIIAGSVAGGLLLLGVLAALYMLYRKRQRRRTLEEGTPYRMAMPGGASPVVIARPPRTSSANTIAAKSGRTLSNVQSGTSSGMRALTRLQNIPVDSEQPAWPPQVKGTYNPALTAAQVQVVRHEDSGLRLDSLGRPPEIVELPPGYTAI